MKKIFSYVWPTLLCFAVGFSASLFQRTSLAEWYPALHKTALTPPDAVFPVVWCLLYICIGLSLSLVLVKNVRSGNIVALWCAQLLLNFLWSLFFFYWQNPLTGMYCIVLLDAVVVLYMMRVYRVRRASMWLFVPYLLWLLLATYMNVYIYFNNPATLH